MNQRVFNNVTFNIYLNNYRIKYLEGRLKWSIITPTSLTLKNRFYALTTIR